MTCHHSLSHFFTPILTQITPTFCTGSPESSEGTDAGRERFLRGSQHEIFPCMSQVSQFEQCCIWQLWAQSTKTLFHCRFWGSVKGSPPNTNNYHCWLTGWAGNTLTEFDFSLETTGIPCSIPICLSPKPCNFHIRNEIIFIFFWGALPSVVHPSYVDCGLMHP